MRLPERRLAVDPAVGFEFGQRAALGHPQHLVDQFARAHVKAAMRGAETLGQAGDHLVIGAAFARRLDQLRPEDEILVAAAAIDVVVLEEGRRRQHDVGHLRRLGHELFVHADEQIVAGKALLDLVLIGRNRTPDWCSG